MPIEVLKNAHVTVNGVDLSDHVEQVQLSYSAELQDATAMGAGTRARVPGLLDWSLSLSFRQDFDVGEVDATLFGLVGAAAFPVILRRDAAVVAADNPQYSGNGLIESYQPIGGSVGEVHNAPVEIQAGGTLARATS